MRSILGAVTVAVSLPMIDAYAIVITYMLFAVLVWISSMYVYLF